MSAKRRLIEAVEVTEEGIHIVRLMKVFDASSLDEFEKVLAYLLSRNHYRIVVDLTSVEFISSAGWGAFTAELRRVRDNGGDIRLAGMNPDVLDVFLLLELDSFINAYDIVDDAILSFDAATERAPQQDFFAGAGAGLLPTEHVAPDHDLFDTSRLPHALEHDHQNAVESHEETYTGGAEQHSSLPFSDATAPEPKPFVDEEQFSLPHATAEPDLLSSVADEFFNWSPYGSGDATSFEKKTTTTSKEFEASPAPHFESDDSFYENEDGPLDHSASGAHEDSDEPIETSMWAGDFSEDESESQSSDVSPHAVARDSFDAVDPEQTSGVSAQTEQFYDDFASQDINDPWILDEIDTLPEEYEMEEVNWRDESGYVEKAPTFLDENREASSGYSNPDPGAGKSFGGGVDTSAAVQQAATQGVRLKDYMTAWAAAQKKPTATVDKAESAPENGSRQEVSQRQNVSVNPAATRQRSDETPATAPAFAHIDQHSKQAFRNGPQPIRKLQTAQRIQFDGDRSALIRQIVSEHPHYGPTMIQKFLEVRIEPAISVSRSTVYRWLRQEELNTREQRLQFAGRATTN